jgi:hypothetical protein
VRAINKGNEQQALLRAVNSKAIYEQFPVFLACGWIDGSIHKLVAAVESLIAPNASISKVRTS